MDSAILAKRFPTLKVRNRRDISTQVSYMNGDSVQLPPNSLNTISSAGLGQLPPFDLVEFVSPTLLELHEAGVITLGRAAPEPAAAVEAPAAEEAVAVEGDTPIVSPTAKKRR